MIVGIEKGRLKTGLGFRRPFLQVLLVKISKFMPLCLFQYRKGKNDEVDILISHVSDKKW
ncbi:hypothetical protein MCC93_06750 [Morococcus cerebrosus]|uniref:Uncharacterized protein n=1 Tax=Morococcus cerebrosus TaxID=1056807 RepID=A0A0C1GWV4_9NEIS|nr:hypothetical protein MCC93_06750 [Morococcus cerebrosus]